MFALQFTPKSHFMFNALFIHSRFQERAKSAGNLLSLLWPQGAKQKALSGALALCPERLEGPCSPAPAGTSAVIRQSPHPPQRRRSPVAPRRGIEATQRRSWLLSASPKKRGVGATRRGQRTGGWHCRLNLSILTDGSVTQRSYRTQFKKALRKVTFLRI